MTNDSFPDKVSLIAAVDRFSKRHDALQIDRRQKIYRDLIPAKTPRAGEQYAFEVDLDKCTGCKACVTACHNQNGLEESETWRSVGLLQGGGNGQPVTQHITTACHHCLDPACMSGCPTKAYTKDKETGIVKHLDDQCFGCQYCILKCPYDVPKYNKKKGIVHKCDMCIGRLKAGELPACVGACPTGAIRITLVSTEQVRNNSKEFVNIPDAPASDYTFPTTRYLTKRSWPEDTVSIDYLQTKPEHSHLPLVVMLVLTQLSVGTFLAELILRMMISSDLNLVLSPIHRWIALGTGIVAIAASIFHLGRPLYAFRAVLGLKTSWLSREILAFGAFASLAVFYVWFASSVGMENSWTLFLGGKKTLDVLGAVVFLIGLAGVLCSVMVYRDTRRPFWDHYSTVLKFLMTMILLGTAASSLISFASAGALAPELLAAIMSSVGNPFCFVIIGVSILKMLLESGIFLSLKENDRDYLKRTALLLTGPLKTITGWRFVFGAVGGIIFPAALVLISPGDPRLGTKSISFSGLAFVFLLAGELLERYLFFRAVVPLKMPGGKLN